MVWATINIKADGFNFIRDGTAERYLVKILRTFIVQYTRTVKIVGKINFY